MGWRGFMAASRLPRGAARLVEHGAGVLAGEHGLLEARLHRLALDAEEVPRPRPRLGAGELIERYAITRVLAVVAGSRELGDAGARDRDVPGARGPGVGLRGLHHPGEEGEGRLLLGARRAL